MWTRLHFARTAWPAFQRTLHILGPFFFFDDPCFLLIFFFFFFNDTATTEIYTLSLHDALPICFGGATCDDKSAQIYARFDKNDWRIQPAEFYRFHDAEVNTFGYF